MTTKSEKCKAMFSMLESWKASGQSQQEFCKAQGFAYSIFHYWYKKYRADQNARGSSPFVAVQFEKTPTDFPIVELILPDGRRLTFYQSVEASFMRTLLS